MCLLVAVADAIPAGDGRRESFFCNNVPQWARTGTITLMPLCWSVCTLYSRVNAEKVLLQVPCSLMCRGGQFFSFVGSKTWAPA